MTDLNLHVVKVKAVAMSSKSNSNLENPVQSPKISFPCFRDPNRSILTDDQVANSPSRICGMSKEIEQAERQKAARFIVELGRKLMVPQLCLNTAVLFMHRFFALHSFTTFSKYDLGAAALFCASKIEEHSRKLKHVVQFTNQILCPVYKLTLPQLEAKMETVMSMENLLLSTLGLDLNVNHVHTHVVKGCRIIRASKEVSKISYCLATTSLVKTTLWLTQRAPVVACLCILAATKIAGWTIPKPKDDGNWWIHLDKEVKEEEMEILCKELLNIYEPDPDSTSEP